ncbi:MAG: type II toxin-antitoxin system HicB family antitoxin [Leptolyngbyaceae cyanobacterium RU_5_1]|nr:type II toxin-antitoxin system HicB family antitoxin [Leptolyngbyaceae cyanobacterium RU_5_1]
MSYKLAVLIERDEHGYYAYCPELPGCQSQGDSLEEVKENIQEAIELYLETLSEEEKQTRSIRNILN